MLELNLGRRITGCLERAGVTDLARLLAMEPFDLATIPGLGSASVIAIRQALARFEGATGAGRGQARTANYRGGRDGFVEAKEKI